MNAITRDQYDAIKNDRTFAVITFMGERRTGTYGGLDLVQAMNYILDCQLRNPRLTFLVFHPLPAGSGSQWERSYWEGLLSSGAPNVKLPARDA